MTATLLDGKGLAQKIQQELKENIEKLATKPGLAVLLVGNDPASHIYVGKKEEACKEVGIAFTKHLLEEETTEEEIKKLIIKLNADTTIHGILVQLPLPKHLDTKNILAMIEPTKDVDGITPNMLERVTAKEETFAPCTPKGIIKLLEEYAIPLKGKHAVIINRSNIVGKPLSIMLLNRNATVTICHSQTQNIKEKTKEADILISAIGKSHFITADMVKEGAVVIDVGISRVDGKVKGDVDFESVSKKASFLTPVPGGIGPLTVVCLFRNLVRLAK